MCIRDRSSSLLIIVWDVGFRWRKSVVPCCVRARVFFFFFFFKKWYIVWIQLFLFPLNVQKRFNKKDLMKDLLAKSIKEAVWRASDRTVWDSRGARSRSRPNGLEVWCDCWAMRRHRLLFSIFFFFWSALFSFWSALFSFRALEFSFCALEVDLPAS